jgi:hypothetical protein
VQVIVTTVGFRQTAARELHQDEGTKPRVFHVLVRGCDLQLVTTRKAGARPSTRPEGALADERDWHRMGAHSMACDAAAAWRR